MGFGVQGGGSSSGGAISSVSNSDGTLTISPTTGAVVASVKTLPKSSSRITLRVHWASGSTSEGSFTGSVNSGAIDVQSAGSDPDHPGVLRLRTNASSTAAPNHSWGAGGHIYLGSGECAIEFRQKIPTASDGTDTFSIVVGFMDIIAAGTPVDGAWFRYLHSENSGNWQCITSSNSSQTVTNTSTGINAGGWQDLRIEVNADGTQVLFKVDGTTVATHTATIPTGSGRSTGIAFMLDKDAGTTSRELLNDYVDIDIAI